MAPIGLLAPRWRGSF
ncbi:MULTISPECIES: hypothetical protein [Caulobacter]|nr:MULTISPECIES: hypothetical protein [Caulobacter]UAL12923.1 hypothetical protein K8940_00060 [Caulobacter segnis]